ncbi:MAG TPA: nitrate ABC transporter ATP-binding protein, partial [Verrucomicrobiales bacterium]|nr:nitrate ABC transporter ATP-binding protein [Verrucomicrobiales bacterium]
MAAELGCFAQHDLDAQLQRERDWTVLGNRFANGELDAIHAPATFAFTLPLGLHSDPCPCLAPLVLSLQGNAITLAGGWRERGVTDARSLAGVVQQLAGRRLLTFGVPHTHSVHAILLRQWLRQGGIHPDRQVRIISVPPMEMFPHLKLGYLDG